MSTGNNRELHRNVMYSLIDEINRTKNQPFILKGGTALMRCYGLDRFSEDIDLDAPARMGQSTRLFRTVEAWAQKNGYHVRVAKNTQTVKRIFAHYGGSEPHAVKIEASMRRATIDESKTRIVDGVRVYNLSELCKQKCAAYQSRSKIRDLYDVTWMCTQKYDELEDSAREAIALALEYRNIDHFDYMIATNTDPLIDTDELELRFLESFDKVGLMGIPREPAKPQVEGKPRTVGKQGRDHLGRFTSPYTPGESTGIDIRE